MAPMLVAACFRHARAIATESPGGQLARVDTHFARLDRIDYVELLAL